VDNAPKLDFHNHVIPAVDDGAPDIEASLNALAIMKAQGIRHVIATPHLRASAVSRKDDSPGYFERVDASWRRLVEAAKSVSEVSIYRGFEILLDVPAFNLAEPTLRLAGSQFALVEFGFSGIPPHSADALFQIKMQNCVPIVAHPERYLDTQEHPAQVVEWLRVGAHLQVNAGSFVGQYGRIAEKLAWRLLELGVLSYACSDYHATGTCHTSAAYAAISRRHGPEIPRMLFSENPLRILRNEAPLPVKPPPRKGLIGWLKTRFAR
jgi:protein-tyrosine phosphatase